MCSTCFAPLAEFLLCSISSLSLSLSFLSYFHIVFFFSICVSVKGCGKWIFFFYILFGPLLRTRGVLVAYRKRQCIFFLYIFFKCYEWIMVMWVCVCSFEICSLMIVTSRGSHMYWLLRIFAFLFYMQYVKENKVLCVWTVSSHHHQNIPLERAKAHVF